VPIGLILLSIQFVVDMMIKIIGITFGTILMVAGVIFWLSIVKFWNGK